MTIRRQAWWVLAASLLVTAACGPDGGTSLQGPDRDTRRQPLKTKRLTGLPQPKRERTPQVDRLLLRLDMVRAACEFYRVKNGNRYPDFDRESWTPLIQSGYLREPPRNPLSPGAAASKIVVVRESGITGAHVDPAQAGWVWVDRGRHGGIMFAAGFSD